MNLRQRIFRRRANKQQTRAKKFRNYYQVHTILIIFESDYMERNEMIQSFINQLKNDNKDVEAWGYVENKDSTTSSIRPFRIIGRKDVNIFHVPRKSALADMAHDKYDLILDLRLRPCVPLQYMTLNIDADLKAGADLACDSHFKRILDFMIKLPEHEGEPTEQDVKLLFDDLIHYLKVIKEND